MLANAAVGAISFKSIFFNAIQIRFWLPTKCHGLSKMVNCQQYLHVHIWNHMAIIIYTDTDIGRMEKISSIKQDPYLFI